MHGSLIPRSVTPWQCIDGGWQTVPWAQWLRSSIVSSMPKDTTRHTLARQWELLRLLPRRGAGLTVQEIFDELDAKGFSVSLRSIQRDLRELELSFDLLCDCEERPARWSWSDGAATDLLALSAQEATSLLMIEQAAKSQLPNAVLKTLQPRFHQAHNKLQSLSQHHASAMASSYRFVTHGWPLMPPVISTEILETVQKAVASNEQLRVRYLNAPQLQAAPFKAEVPQPKEQVLHPLGLINRGPATYLLATSGRFQDPRLFALHRLQTAVSTYETARRPQGFDLDRWVGEHMQFSDGKSIQLKARVMPALAGVLRETPLTEDQRLDDQSGLLQATVLHSKQLVWWILSQGADIEVLEPSTLRKNIAEQLAKCYALYRINDQ